MMTFYRTTKPIELALYLLLAVLLPIGATYGKRTKVEEPPFQYLYGTENVDKGCAGKLEVMKESLTFRCPGGVVTFPFAGITLMQYRPDLSDEVMGMKIPWKEKPMLSRVRQNRYFTVVCNDQGKLRAIVLRVEEKDMRPYFAEIELQSGKSVDEYRSFGEFN